jgi:predicted Ser/Thr protein kinase
MNSLHTRGGILARENLLGKLQNCISWNSFVLGAFLVCTPLVQAADEAPEAETCDKSLIGDESYVPTAITAKLESYGLMEILQNPKFWLEHPTMVMSAAQKNVAWQTYVPSRQLNTIHGTLNVFPILSELNEVNDRRMLVGNLRNLDFMHGFARAAARGSGAGSKFVLMKGPGGTGKTETLTSIANTASHLSLNNPLYHEFTFEFFNLDQIPVLNAIMPAVRDEQDKNVSTFRTPLNESPIAILPDNIQRNVLKLAAPVVQKLIGLDPLPAVLDLNIQAEYVRDEILKHYAAQDGVAPTDLTNGKILAYLNKHVRIVRRILTKENFPVIEYQGRDPDFEALMGTPNHAVRAIYGVDHPFAYHLNGKFIQASGALLFIDEVLRNEPDFLNTLLALAESHVVQRAGMPRLKIDTYVMGATNNESFDDAQKKSSIGALIQRMLQLPFNYSVRPNEIAKTALLMIKERNLEVAKLPTEDQVKQDLANQASTDSSEKPFELEYKAGDINTLFPIKANGEDVDGMDGNYVARYSGISRGKHIYVAPHTITFMAAIAAATRMDTDARKALKAMNGDGIRVINSEIFTEEVSRLKLFLGDYEEPTPTQKVMLDRISLNIDEGRFGMNQRDFGYTWLEGALQEAAKPENRNTLTPQLAMSVLVKLLDPKSITFRDSAERWSWETLANEIKVKILMPRLERDVLQAAGHSEGNIDEIYDLIVAQFLALNKDPNAEIYQDKSGKSHKIDRPLLNSINKFHYERTGRYIVPQELINFVAVYASRPGARYKQLEYAIVDHLAQTAFESVSLSSMIEYQTKGSGGANVREKYNSVASYLSRYLGYNEAAIQSVIELVNDYRLKFKTKPAQ